MRFDIFIERRQSMVGERPVRNSRRNFRPAAAPRSRATRWHDTYPCRIVYLALPVFLESGLSAHNTWSSTRYLIRQGSRRVLDRQRRAACNWEVPKQIPAVAAWPTEHTAMSGNSISHFNRARNSFMVSHAFGNPLSTKSKSCSISTRTALLRRNDAA